MMSRCGVRWWCAWMVAAAVLCGAAGENGSARAAAAGTGAGRVEEASDARIHETRRSPVKPVIAPLRSVRRGELSLWATEQAEQGSVLPVRIRVRGAGNTGKRVAFLLNGKRVCTAVLRTIADRGEPAGEAAALLPVAVDAPAGRPLRVEARLDGRSVRADVPVAAVAWPVQKLRVEPKYVQPSKTDAARIARERERVRAALAKMTPERFWKTPFVRPVPGGVTSAFGGKRVFNGQTRSYHRGVDLRGAQGTPVRSAADGVVVLAEEQYFSGKVVFVDHGEGLVTMYCHLSDIRVKPGETVRAGRELGLVGATGRVTGPHLHWGVFVGGGPVNPLALLALES